MEHAYYPYFESFVGLTAGLNYEDFRRVHVWLADYVFEGVEPMPALTDDSHLLHVFNQMRSEIDAFFDNDD